MIGFGITNKGLVRKSNEDSFLCCLKRKLFVVADGMGGHLAGEVASNMTINTINNRLKKINEDSIDDDLNQAVLEANTKVHLASLENKAFSGMGTTLTALMIDANNKAHIAHVGDSRAYLIRDKKIELLTKDHSLVSELLCTGQISNEDAKRHPQRHMLTRALGTNPIVEVDKHQLDLLSEDILLLCTDGLSNLVSATDMKKIINANSVHIGAAKLLEMALQKGGHDNVTIVIVKV